MEKFYTTDEIAVILRVSPATLRKYLREGKIEGLKIGYEWRISETALNNFMNSIKNITNG